MQVQPAMPSAAFHVQPLFTKEMDRCGQLRFLMGEAGQAWEQVECVTRSDQHPITSGETLVLAQPGDVLGGALLGHEREVAAEQDVRGVHQSTQAGQGEPVGRHRHVVVQPAQRVQRINMGGAGEARGQIGNGPAGVREDELEPGMPGQ